MPEQAAAECAERELGVLCAQGRHQETSKWESGAASELGHLGLVDTCTLATPGQPAARFLDSSSGIDLEKWVPAAGRPSWLWQVDSLGERAGSRETPGRRERGSKGNVRTTVSCAGQLLRAVWAERGCLTGRERRELEPARAHAL